MADDVDDAGFPELSLAHDLAPVRMDMAMQEKSRPHPFDRTAYGLQPSVRRIGAFVDPGRRAVGDQDIEAPCPKPDAQGQHLGHHLPLGVLMRPVAVPYGAFEPRDQKTPLPHDSPVDLGGGGVVPLPPRQVVVAADEEQGYRVNRGEHVEVVGGQVAAADQQIDPTLGRHRPLVHQLRLDLIADGEQADVHRRPRTASRYASSAKRGSTSRWYRGRSTSGCSLSAGTFSASCSS